MNGKCCNICLSEFPATAEFFGRHCGRKDGLRETCLWCRRKVRAEERERAKERKRRADMRHVANRLCAGALMPHADEFLRVAMQQVGGPHALAVEFGRQMELAKPATWLRMAEGMLNLSEQVKRGDECKPFVSREELAERQEVLTKTLVKMVWERSQRGDDG